jgi:pimeloyl-ACP methyl ester carboxylesterase
MVPTCYFRYVAHLTLRAVSRKRRCRMPHLEKAIHRLSPRPLLMIHGGKDTYIKPEIARTLYQLAGEPKEYWEVKGAKHNQAIQLATEEYQARVLAFFDTHLASFPAVTAKEDKSLNLIPRTSTRALQTVEVKS